MTASRAGSVGSSGEPALPVAAPACAPVVASRVVLRRAGLVVRGLDAELELHPPDALEDPLLEHAAAGEDVAHHREREQLDRDDEERGAEDQRLDVPVALALEEEPARTGPRAPSPTSATAVAAATNTRSGS